MDPRYFRLAEVETLLGDPSKAAEKLGWKPRTTFPALVSEMMAADLVLAKRDAYITEGGFHTPKAHQ